MKIVIAGGGTGGHVLPGIAVAEEFKHRNEKAEVIFIGTEHGIESRLIPKEGYPVRFIPAEGFVGKSPVKKIKSLIKMCSAVFYSRDLLKAIKPDIVIGTGGYASFVPVGMACLLGIPTLIMEQNLVPGMANRVLGRFVDAIAVTYHESITFFPISKTRLTGNPIRRKMLSPHLDRKSAYEIFSLKEDMFTVFVSGGSSGSRSINNAVVNCLNYLFDIKGNVQFLHQTGDADYESIRNAYRKSGIFAMVTPFIYQMAEAYSVADLVISRAGATTLAEITALGKPAILIPYPYARGHQEFNARKLAEAGASRLILEVELRGEVLAQNIKEIYMSEDLRAGMKKQSLAMGMPDSGEKVVNIALSLINLKKKS
ncbi:MAG: undecaprenyldiphospho-muramoylpentapeptide beta-N-acetylglucosaminyltransferase [Nitrospirae bacterium]|nr:undecaprenyldiphospho-muramoylpentapeptide beta-N-acetylglucosaminyltransferase [Nitrospirota bacterium]